ncbi:DUF4834 family protein [Nonlabens antarcticus]|uniref:DUF4834 family protein n=1 Tax=Nonlabens antarcticus TaxID=392714 RepID=UPI001891E4CC|nr:DUF4834 family protein [Nonlabens antarcticus]
MKLLQAILIIIGVYLAVRLILKHYGKSILSWAGKKAMQRVQKQFNQRQTPADGSTIKDGETELKSKRSHSSPSGKNPNKTVGEYVDYEEID